MRKKIEWNFEKLDEFTKRAKIIGGWIVHHGIQTNKGPVSESMVFIADRDHEWTIVQPVYESKPAGVKVSSADFEASKG